MDSPATAKCPCQHCATNLEFPFEANGTEIDCPACGQKTVLFQPENITLESTPLPSTLDIKMLTDAFRGPVKRTPVPFFYTLGLAFVSSVMVLLPALYLAFIGAVIWAGYYWATHFTWLVKYDGGGGIRFYIIKCIAYGSGLFVAAVLFFFMVKPLFARRAPHAQPLALNPGAEPLLFTFITHLCRTVGAPFPTRIDVDCNFNAAASFRRGMRSLFSNDLVLTIGLPLAAGFSIRQFAGVIAHEFGHFTQGFGMRLSYVIRSVNNWFARVIYERDTWDLALEEWTETESAWLAMVVGCARLAIWFSRSMLKLLMITAHGISCFMLRQMEYDADSYEIKVVGSATFEETNRRFALVGHALQETYKDMRTKWNLNRALPADFSAYLLKHVERLPEAVRSHIDDRIGLAKTGLFDTHPSDGDRIRCARQAAESGVLDLDGRARDLFGNFDALSRQVTLLHYSDDLGLPVAGAILQPIEDSSPASVRGAEPDERTEEEQAARANLKLKLRKPGE